MTLRSLLLASAASLAFPFAGLAQDFSCTANDPDHMLKLHHNDPHRLQEMQQAQDRLDAFTADWTAASAARGDESPYVVPVVFHIIHNDGIENISNDQIEDEMRILNEDFNKMNPEWPNVRPEFLDIVADVGVTFRLAQLDPDGNCTNGITRTKSALTNDGTQDMKDLIQWPRDRYLNVWVAASADGAAGYAMYPGSVDSNWGAPADGIVILHSYVGSIGTSSYSHSHALSHEVGHWINLSHCWGSTNDPGVNCDGSDNVADTPPTMGWTSCNLNGATCGSALDNVENIMEYAYCQKMFTNGQKARMLSALNSSIADRNNLWSPGNLAATGVGLDPQLCAIEIHTNTRQICAGSSVAFTDASYNGVTEREWTFAGGTPTTSEEAQPVVTYAEPGLYAVTLTAGNGTNTLSATEENYILVLPASGQPTPYSESFEAVDAVPSTNWMVNNPDGDNTFTLRTDAAYTGTHSIRLKNTSIITGRVDELISNTIDLSDDTLPILTFRHAFARRNISNNDMLRVFLSDDCGDSWSLRYVLHGNSSMPTAPDQLGNFIPNGPEQWAFNEIDNIGTNFSNGYFRMKFWFSGGGGNDLWLDDININGQAVTGINGTDAADAFSAQVVPNPATDEAQLVLSLPQSGAVKAELLDPTGRVIGTIANSRLGAGPQRWSLPTTGLRSGLYLVRIQFGGQGHVVRFTKQ